MEVALNPELEELIAEQVESGHYPSPGEVVRDALRLFKKQLDLRERKLESPHRDVQVGLEALERGREAATVDDEIDRLYAELRDLVRRSGEEDLDDEIRARSLRLRQLQTAEADAMERRFLARRHLAPGRGWKALERAQEILADEDPATSDESARSRD